MNRTGGISWLRQTGQPAAGGSIATSLFGGAILASVATTAFAQVNYFDNASLLSHGLVTSGFVILGGNLALGDGGGGTFMPGPAGCGGGDGGIIFPDGSATPNCFYRADPTYSVREWGAKCDVVAVNAAGAANWNPGTAGSTMGTLTVPTSLLTGTPTVVSGDTIYIAISQIGAPTLFGTATPAVSLTRYTQLGGTQVNYHVGDVISFVGTTGNEGSFSQEAAIIVDAVSGGTITNWHFLWGGLYAGASPSPPTGTMIQDSTRSFCGSVVGTGFIACGADRQGLNQERWDRNGQFDIAMRHGRGGPWPFAPDPIDRQHHAHRLAHRR